MQNQVTTQPAPQVLVKRHKGTINVNLGAPAPAPVHHHPCKPLFTEMTRPQYLRYGRILCILLDMVHHDLIDDLQFLLYEPRKSERYKAARAKWEDFWEESKEHRIEDIYEVYLYCTAQLNSDARASGVWEKCDEE